MIETRTSHIGCGDDLTCHLLESTSKCPEEFANPCKTRSVRERRYYGVGMGGLKSTTISVNSGHEISFKHVGSVFFFQQSEMSGLGNVLNTP